jgi:CRP/FNR family cyclic AMP-dependent transcriptional regulator
MQIDRYSLFADPTRRRVLAALAGAGAEGRTAGALAAELGLGRSLVSYHLARLLKGGLAGIVDDPSDRRRRRYVVRAHAAARGVPCPMSDGWPPPPDRVARGTSHPALGDGLAPDERAVLERYRRRRAVERGTVLFWQGDPPSGIWYVERGAVRIYTSDADGREQTLQVAQAGDSFNEVPFFDGGPEPATAQVLEPGSVALLPFEQHDEILRAVPVLASEAASAFAARLRHVVALVEDLRFRQVTGRVARVLLQAVEPHPGVGAGAGGRSLTQREIAEMAGTSREVVARALRELQRDGLLRMERGRIVLLDRARLADRS